MVLVVGLHGVSVSPLVVGIQLSLARDRQLQCALPFLSSSRSRLAAPANAMLLSQVRLCIVQNGSWHLEWLSVSTSACLNRLIDIANMLMRHYENMLDSRLKLFGAGQLSLNGVSPSQFEATDDTGESPLKQALTSAMASTMGTCMRSV